MSRSQRSATESYIDILFAPESQELQRVAEKLKADGKWGINLGSYEGKFLQILIRLAQVKKVLEIGTLYGYSSLWMAEVLPIGGELYTLEKDPENYNIAKSVIENSSHRQKVHQLLGDAEVILEQLKIKAPFDLIFIDANKSGYLRYLDWAEQHVKPGGLIVGDNTLLFGHVVGTHSNQSNMSAKNIEVMREFNRRLADSSKYHSVLMPTSEGMTIAIKK